MIGLLWMVSGALLAISVYCAWRAWRGSRVLRRFRPAQGGQFGGLTVEEFAAGAREFGRLPTIRDGEIRTEARAMLIRETPEGRECRVEAEAAALDLIRQEARARAARDGLAAALAYLEGVGDAALVMGPLTAADPGDLLLMRAIVRRTSRILRHELKGEPDPIAELERRSSSGDG